MKIKGKCHNWNCFFDFSLSKETLVEKIASFLKQSTGFRSIIISVLLFKLCFANSNWFRHVFPWWRRAQLEKLVLLSFRRQKRRRKVLHAAIEFFFTTIFLFQYMGIYLADSFKKNLAKKREEFLRLRCERKGKEKNKGRGGRTRRRERNQWLHSQSLYWLLWLDRRGLFGGTFSRIG